MNHPSYPYRRLAAEAAALGPDLISAAIRVLGGPNKAAQHLSALTGRALDANRMCRYRRGGEAVPDWLQDACRVVVADELLGDDGLAVARLMSPPDRKKKPA